MRDLYLVSKCLQDLMKIAIYLTKGTRLGPNKLLTATSVDPHSGSAADAATQPALMSRVPDSRQRGFSLIEVSIVSAIILLLAIIAIPAINNYVVENRVPKVGEALARFIVLTQVNASGGSATPYATIDTVNLANVLGDASIFSVSSSGADTVIGHGLGNEGSVDVAPVSEGKQFSISLSKVSDAACPGIASVLQRVAQNITVNTDAGAETTLKSPSQAYSAMAAEAACKKGSVNTFVFTAG